MKIQFNLPEVLILADEGLKVMREENPELEAWPEVNQHFEAILGLLAFTEPKCLADYTVTLDVLTTFED